MAKDCRKPLNVRAVNPRYGTATMGDVARALTRPKSLKARAVIEKLQAKASRRAVEGDEPAVKSAL